MKQVLLLLIFILYLFIPCFGQENNSLFVVIVNDRRGFIDGAGKIVIEPQFQGANDFVEERAVVAVSTDKYKLGYIDKTGKFIAVPQFDDARDFSEGTAAVGIGEFKLHGGGNHKWGFIDKSGNIIIEPSFKDSRNFSEGLAAVTNQEGKWGYIDKTGKVVIPFQFEDAFSFSEGLACVLIDGLFGFIDKTGKVIIEPRFSLSSEFKEGLAGVKIGNPQNKPYKLYGTYIAPDGDVIFVDKTGKTIIKLAGNVKNVNSFSEGLALVQVEKDGSFPVNGYIDKTGKFIIEPIFFGFAGDFSEGLALIEQKDKIGFVDKTGKIIINPVYSYGNSFRNGLAWIEKGSSAGDLKNSKFGYIDKMGKVIWKPTK